VEQWFKIWDGPHLVCDRLLEGDEVNVVGVIATAQSDGGDD